METNGMMSRMFISVVSDRDDMTERISGVVTITPTNACTAPTMSAKTGRFIDALDDFKKNVPVKEDINVISFTKDIVKITSYWFDDKFADFIKSLGGDYEVLGQCKPGDRGLLVITIYFI